MRKERKILEIQEKGKKLELTSLKTRGNIGYTTCEIAARTRLITL